MDSNKGSAHSIGWPLEFTVFVCGALVMIFEINGSRIVSPFLGTSTYIWTSLIGVILAALSVGYWLGGRTADRFPHPGILATVLFAAGGLVSVTVIVGEIVLAGLAALPMGLGLRSIVASSILFAPASILFGFVLPFAAKIRITSLNESGATVGRLYALSTIGSIAGTFAAGFLLIPSIGSVRTLYLVAGILFILGLILVPYSLSRLSIGAITLFLLSVGSTEALRGYKYSAYRFLDIDTEYSRLSIFDAVEPASGRKIRAISNDPYFLQSAAYLDGDELVFEYLRFFDVAIAFAPKIERSLLIGGAGYSFPRNYLRMFPNATIDVVEIDPRMTEIARDHFRLGNDERMNIFHEDARLFVRNSNKSLYDVVYMDAFGTLFSVPTHLTTVEFFNDLKKTMAEDGVLVMNLGGAMTGEASLFFHAEIATLESVFENVLAFKVNPQKSDDEMQNIVIVAGSRSDSKKSASADVRLQTLLKQVVMMDPENKLPVLTDDLAPVEYYNSIAQSKYVRDRSQ